MAFIPIHLERMSRMARIPTLYHNPKCGTSRKVLGWLREAGIEPEIVEYLKTPPSSPEMAGLLAKMGVTPRELLRRKEAAYAELGLDSPDKTDAEILAALASHPILMERPILVTAKGAVLCRPAERARDVM